jgi:DNA mismatch repair ATPase MutS
MTKFSKAYYPTSKPVTNSYTLNKNIIITGPNASGKTTFIKMTLINLLLSQQIGCGFYKKATIYPFDTFCSYINIPDTSGRDSLFQAEARRCKEVLECVKHSDRRVFCIFDELFSGTNPNEASASAYAFLQYLSTYRNCSFVLTTHFINVCKQLFKNTFISMKHMKTIEYNNKLQYTYKITKGISTVQGGIHILEDMNYPTDIINSAKLCG